MGYRIGEPKRKAPNRTMQDTATPSRVFVINGETSHLAVPCWYLVVEPPVEAHCHDRAHHDHVGWPSPNHPDHVCQLHDFAHSCSCSTRRARHHGRDRCEDLLDVGRMLPVHLLREGYTEARIAFDDPPEGLSGKCEIDSKSDWIVRVELDVRCPEAVKEKQETRFTVFVGDGKKLNDVASTGLLTILPGPYE